LHQGPLLLRAQVVVANDHFDAFTPWQNLYMTFWPLSYQVGQGRTRTGHFMAGIRQVIAGKVYGFLLKGAVIFN
jgi:hypothetical protein